MLSEYKQKYQIIRNQIKLNALYKVSEFVSLALFAPEPLVVLASENMEKKGTGLSTRLAKSCHTVTMGA